LPIRSARLPIKRNASIHSGRQASIANMVDLQEFTTGSMFTALPIAALVLTGFGMLSHIRAAAGTPPP
jgi:hypothetical protein